MTTKSAIRTRGAAAARMGNEYTWNVRTVGGARVPSGVYWATLEIAGERHVSKFSVIR